jgi:proline iminopeptidase
VWVAANGTRLWFAVEGDSLVPVGPTMQQRPTVIFVHGGPGSYDHSYLRPHFAALARDAQLVYLDLRDHGRSARHDPDDWTFELAADDLRAFCDALGIERPFVVGHSMGGFVALQYGARHVGHAAGLVIIGSGARLDVRRLVEGVRSVAGDEVAELARRSYSGEEVSEQEWARVFAAFGPHVPSSDELARRVRNDAIVARGVPLLRGFDIRGELASIASPTLVMVGEVDPVTPVAASKELMDGLPRGIGRMEIVGAAGHFPWLDAQERVVDLIAAFMGAHAAAR